VFDHPMDHGSGHGVLAVAVLRIVFYFHPMVRFASRQLGLERELACDDRLVSFGAEPQIVAAHWRSNKKRQAAGNRRPAFFC
jgi:hypothetical protein